MEKFLGPIAKMRAYPESPVRYELPIGDAALPLNGLLGKPVRFRYTGRIFCSNCGNLTKSSFNQGYCFKCMQTLAQCDLCIVKPELCHFHHGTCREPEWGEAHCMIEHTVYLANSSGLKVGITRSRQMRTRWMDQGAVQALPIVRVKSRFDSGKVESTLSRLVPDKTNWRAMLQGHAVRIDLKAERDKLFAAWGPDLPGERVWEEEHVFNYPVLAYPAKPATLNLDKQPEAAGELLGIKGQYLILSSGVINMRKYGGYELEWEAGGEPARGAEAGAAAAGTASGAPTGGSTGAAGAATTGGATIAASTGIAGGATAAVGPKSAGSDSAQTSLF